jgi:hypothetical protein
MAPIYGAMADSTVVLGLRIKCQAVEFSHGQMAEYTKVSTRMVASMALEPFVGQMENGTPVTGSMVGKHTTRSELVEDTKL